MSREIDINEYSYPGKLLKDGDYWDDIEEDEDETVL